VSLEYSERALGDLEAIADYFREIGEPDAGEMILARIFATGENIGRLPLIGRRQDIPGVRKIVATHTSYLIYYSVDDASGDVVILTVQHARLGARPFDDA
jgi:plasmid stabilization system protein ParE